MRAFCHSRRGVASAGLRCLHYSGAQENAWKGAISDETESSEKKDFQLPLRVTGSHQVVFFVADDLESALKEWSLKSLILRLSFDGLSPEQDEIDLCLNGSKLRFKDFGFPSDPVGFRYACMERDLTDGPLPKQGKNALRIELKRRCADVSEPLLLTGVELLTRYH